MKKYWKNVKNTGKVYEKILEKCKKNPGKVREIRQSKKVGTMATMKFVDLKDVRASSISIFAGKFLLFPIFQGKFLFWAILPLI